MQPICEVCSDGKAVWTLQDDLEEEVGICDDCHRHLYKGDSGGLTPQFREFFLGVVASEGSFIIHASRRDERLGVTIRPEFQLKMHRREGEMLDELQTQLGLGKLRERSSRPYIAWRIGRIDECLRLVEILEDFTEGSLFAKTDKARAFRKWREILYLIDDGKHLTKDGLKRILKMRESINWGSKGIPADELIERVNQYSDE